MCWLVPTLWHRLHCRYVINLVTDINECANGLTIDCTQQCINTPGSYECDCYDGYRAITANATQCEGMNEYIYVMCSI